MDNEFKFEKSKSSNVIRSIRFDEDLHSRIEKVVIEANSGKKTKQYSFNGFVTSACEFALSHMNNNNSKKK